MCCLCAGWQMGENCDIEAGVASTSLQRMTGAARALCVRQQRTGCAACVALAGPVLCSGAAAGTDAAAAPAGLSFTGTASKVGLAA